MTTTGASAEMVSYDYNLQNRLEKVTTTKGATVEVVDYTYNDDGIRVKSEFVRTISGVNDQTRTTTYLVDSYNHTGYAQTLEEQTITTDYVDGVPQTPVNETITYTIGDDVISQYNSTDGTEYLLYDGHGSTRQLAEYSAGSGLTIEDSYSYDGYGVLLQNDSVASADPGKVAQQSTNLLYTGEQWDTAAQMYYLRARYYDPLNGRFNRVDPFAGNTQDPQSLHKYLYANCNPVNAIDPAGCYSGITDVVVTMAILSTLTTIMGGAITYVGRPAGGPKSKN